MKTILTKTWLLTLLLAVTVILAACGAPAVASRVAGPAASKNRPRKPTGWTTAR